uniref:ATP synthase F0 subunit 8 n=1 Tax=Ibalia leucospoides TaxID=32408 RepID=A0A0E3DQX1_9HYME|nr:ATP synthase F0 subunit 8 [Ibalia leucospoides]AIK21707.1 ATP synthase F0 subunit 8 [Ibalia leucospoides]
MPQMKPLNWMILMMYFFMCFLLINVYLYFMNFMNNFKKKNSLTFLKYKALFKFKW